MLTLKNVSLFYGEGNKILDDITLDVADGECVLLTGESGSGKSSIINSINGLAYSYENASITGNIEVGGKQIKSLELYEISLMIASVFQNPKTYFFNVNTTQELLFYLENIGLDKKEMEHRMKNMLEIFPIEHLLGRSIFELSGGEKQILCVASCYISGCKIIVLDEPSSNLDDKYIKILKEMLQILKDKGITLMIAEHRIYYLMDVTDRVVFLQKGMIKKIFTKNDFLTLTSEQLVQMGLRSTHKTILKKSKTLSAGDLIIRKMMFDFQDGGVLKLENVSFDLGKIYGVIGKNGCGKSTFLRIVTGLDKKNNSQIVFKDRVLGKKDMLKKSSLVMQDVNHQLFVDSVEEEVKLGVKEIDQDKINQILCGLGMDELKDRHPMSLSGGEKQRVAIASVLCKNSEFIFFDEPTSGMDFNNMIKISNLIKRMINDKIIIFIVSHDIEFLNATADMILDLEDFRSYVDQ